MSPGSTVDVIGVLMELGATGSIQRKSGDAYAKRELKLADESNAMITVTLWGDSCEAVRVNVGDIMALKGCRISDYAGRSLNASSLPSDI